MQNNNVLILNDFDKPDLFFIGEKNLPTKARLKFWIILF